MKTFLLASVVLAGVARAFAGEAAAQLESAQKAESEARAALSTAEQTQARAQSQVDEATAAVAAATDDDTKKGANSSLKTAKSALADAKKAVTAAKKEVTKAESAAKAASKAAEKEAAKAAKLAQAESNKMPSQNGITRPKGDSALGRAWAIFDQVSAKNNSPASIGETLPVAKEAGLNEATTRTQYARWRKFHGVSGRIEAPKQATSEQTPPPPPPAS